MDRVGIFTPQHEDFLTEVIAERINVKNFWFNIAKKKIIHLILSSTDNHFLHKLQPSWKALLIPIIDAAMSGQYDLARARIAQLLDTKINFNNVSSVTQEKFFESLTVALATSIDMYIEGRTAA